MARVLFILKQRKLYGSEVQLDPNVSTSSGLYNSARFVSDMLDLQRGIVSEVVEVVDNNSIDREVTRFQPTHVIIEALWVVPEKFDVLHRLHPDVQWIIRLHSNTPFLANEGVAFEWINGYLRRPNVSIAVNHELMFEDLAALYPQAFEAGAILLQPNYYPLRRWPGDAEKTLPFWSPKVTRFNGRKPWDNDVHIGCFGAIRPLKNQVAQAIAAISYADATGQNLFFHINSSRVEKGENCLKNLRAMFDGSVHTLVEHSWMPHEEFRALVSQMDANMQVSFSETFNIVTADSVSQGVPVVVSKEIEWVSKFFVADPTDTSEIEARLAKALMCPTGPWQNLRGLKKYNRWSKKLWLNYFKDC